MRQVALALALTAVLAACASSGVAPSIDRNVLTAQELEAVPTANVYEALQRLRPEFLSRNRGPTSINLPPVRTVVYINSARYEEVDALRTISANQVAMIRYVHGRDAVTRFGGGHEGGVIIVTTK